MSYEVDKMLPIIIINKKGRFLFAADAAHNEYWVPYCEKAYAKAGFQIYDNPISDWLRAQTYLKTYQRDMKHMKISLAVGELGA